VDIHGYKERDLDISWNCCRQEDMQREFVKTNGRRWHEELGKWEDQREAVLRTLRSVQAIRSPIR
jgi:hypothetical protein